MYALRLIPFICRIDWINIFSSFSKRFYIIQLDIIDFVEFRDVLFRAIRKIKLLCEDLNILGEGIWCDRLNLKIQNGFG